MKKFVLLMLTCGMFANSFSQVEIADKTITAPDKWVITPNKLKTTTGRLLMNNPAGSIWTIYIYTMADNKYVTSFAQSNNKGLFVIAPGEYRITLNNASVQNVLIKKGYDTKLKTGVLNVTDNDVWYLYDESGEIFCISGNKPEKLLMPEGKYILKVGETQRNIAVIGDVLAAAPKEENYSSLKWEITPIMNDEKSMVTENGLIDLKFPGDTTWKMKISKTGFQDILLTAADYRINKTFANEISYPLPAGDYTITLNRIKLEKVPIESGNKTRIRTGLVKINAVYDTAKLSDFSEQHIPYLNKLKWYVYDKAIPFSPHTYYIAGEGSSSVAIPIGRYGIKIWGSYPVDKITVTDKSVTSLDVMMGIVSVGTTPEPNDPYIQWWIFDGDSTVNTEYFCGNSIFCGGNRNVKRIGLPAGRYLIRAGVHIEKHFELAGCKEITIEKNTCTINIYCY